MNLFDALIGNSPRDYANNVVIDPTGGLVLLDHAYGLGRLSEDDLVSRLKGMLGMQDIQHLLKRRDALLARVAKLVRRKR
jgi:hypothetical protein